ncbi:MAG: SMI1/KNR4 family protein [Planctomycetaceae bacterium]
MNSEAIEQLETLLGYSLPEEYLELCRHYPDALRAMLSELWMILTAGEPSPMWN